MTDQHKPISQGKADAAGHTDAKSGNRVTDTDNTGRLTPENAKLAADVIRGNNDQAFGGEGANSAHDSLLRRLDAIAAGE